ncbi:MAG: helix-turn-helix domain-containing protein [Deltaproteobacteria bacterium]|nr:helix-turn-helix domain-containing protein [Deltaproteobacteria bacterium]
METTRQKLLQDILVELRTLRKDVNQLAAPDVTKKFLTLKEASALTGLSPRQLHHYIRNGVLTRYGSRRRVLLSSDELELAIIEGFRKPIDSTPRTRSGKIRPIKLTPPF